MSTIIDTHVHVFDTTVAGAAENLPLWPGLVSGPNDLLAQMDAAGIDKAFLISYTPIDVMAHYPPDRREYMLSVFQHYLTKEHFIRVWEAHRDRFYWFADSVDPRVPGYVERAAQDFARGASGLKLLPLFTDTEISDPKWQPIFQLLRQLGKPCIVDLSWWYAHNAWFAPSVAGKYASFTEYTVGLKRILDEFWDVRVQLAHFGAINPTEVHEVVELMRAHPNLTCDLGAYQHRIQADEPFPYWNALKIVQELVEGVGAKRVQWGTDWPFLGVQPFSELIRAIRTAPFLQPGEADLILGGNALELVENRAS